MESEEQKPTEDEARPSGSEPSAAVRVREGIWSAVLAERGRQEALWGEQNHPDRMPNEENHWRIKFMHEAEGWKALNATRVNMLNLEGASSGQNCAWDGILLEEVYEALAEEDPEKLRTELIQSMAVILNWLECIGRRAAASGKGDEA